MSVTHAWAEHLGLILSVKLCAHEVWVVLDLEDLHALSGFIFSNEMQTSSLQLADIFRVDFISVAVPLFDLRNAAVEGTNLGPLAVGLEDSLPGSETHSASHILLVKLGHGDNHTIVGSGVELFRVSARQTADVTGELDGGGLETKADLGVQLATRGQLRKGCLGDPLTPKKGV